MGSKDICPRKIRKLTEEHKMKIKESCKNCPVIHHINGNHFDDRPENRMVVTPSEHAKIHMLQRDLHIFKSENKCAYRKDKKGGQNGNTGRLR